MMPQRTPKIVVRITDEDQRRRAVDAVLRCNIEQPMEVVIQRYQPKRSTSMNSLWWAWMDQLARHFSGKAGAFGKDDMHELMKHQFLGYDEPRTIGKTEIPRQLRSTAKLSKGDMLHLMQQVDAWAADHGCLLKRPEDNEYDEMARRQNG